MVVDIPAFSPDNLVAATPGATHFRLMAIGASIDFAKNTYSTVSVQSPDIPVDGEMQEALQLSKTLAPAIGESVVSPPCDRVCSGGQWCQ